MDSSRVYPGIPGPQSVPVAQNVASVPYVKAGLHKKPRDGQPPKRRGPKPDSKPAQTRRQELNRQAQRTHRERKEQYIRALEVEISRLREGYHNDMQVASRSIEQQQQFLQAEKEENRALREILMSHGFNPEVELEQRRSMVRASSQASFPESTQSRSASYQAATSYVTPDTTISSGRSPVATGAEFPDLQNASSANSYQGGPPAHHPTSNGQLDTSNELTVSSNGSVPIIDVPGVFDEDPQLQVDFILALEGTCRDHIERLCRRAHDDPEQDVVAGHILMATCPPPTEVANAPRGVEYPVKTYDLPPANLNTLLNLSRQLVTDSEITPIMALQALKFHPLYQQLSREDVRWIMEDLLAKVRCYGFGAVLEEFEFRDSLNSILGTKIVEPVTATAVEALPLLGCGNQDDTMYS